MALVAEPAKGFVEVRAAAHHCSARVGLGVNVFGISQARITIGGGRGETGESGQGGDDDRTQFLISHSFQFAFYARRRDSTTLHPRTIFMNFLIYRDGNVFVGQQIPELHHALSLPRQLAPAAGLLRILLNGFVFDAGIYVTHGSEALAAGAHDPETAAFDHNFGPSHQLLSYYQKSCSVQHIFHFGTKGLTPAAAEGSCCISLCY